MKAISYSLFGYGKDRQQNCFDFFSYTRGLMINIRLNRLLYPGWKNILHTDSETHAAFHILLNNIPDLTVVICEPAPLCLAMLWRMKPIFSTNSDGTWRYTHVICRDLDSPTTHREAQAVQIWIEHDKAMHSITDSVSHNLPLMGGMIGINPRYFTERIAQNWDEMISMCGNQFNWTCKGTDQTFLMSYIYPRFASKGTESITQHYVLGHGDTFLNDYHSAIPDVPVSGVSEEMKESNDTCGHIGAAGNYQGPTFQFLRKHKEKFIDLIELEKNYPLVFNWTQDGTFA